MRGTTSAVVPLEAVMNEYTVVYCNSKLHNHPPCWRVWAKSWAWYTNDEFATRDAAQAEADRRNAASAKGH